MLILPKKLHLKSTSLESHQVYYISGSITKLPRKGLLEVSLKTLTCELYTISPIKVSGLTDISLGLVREKLLTVVWIRILEFYILIDVARFLLLIVFKKILSVKWTLFISKGNVFEAINKVVIFLAIYVSSWFHQSDTAIITIEMPHVAT